MEASASSLKWTTAVKVAAAVGAVAGVGYAVHRLWPKSTTPVEQEMKEEKPVKVEEDVVPTTEQKAQSEVEEPVVEEPVGESPSVVVREVEEEEEEKEKMEEKMEAVCVEEDMAVTSEAPKKEGASEEYEVYVNHGLGIRLLYKKTWQRLDETSAGVPVKFILANPNPMLPEEFHPNIIFAVEQLPDGMGLSDYVAASKKAIHDMFSQFGVVKFLEEKKIKAGDVDAVRMTHQSTFVVPGAGEMSMKQMSIIVCNESLVYSLQYLCGMDYFDKYLKEAMICLDNISFVEGVLTRDELKMMTTILYQDPITGLGMMAPSQFKVHHHPSDGVVVSFVSSQPNDAEGTQSINIVVTVADRKGLPELLSDVVAANMLHIFKFTAEKHHFALFEDRRGTACKVAGENAIRYEYVISPTKKPDFSKHAKDTTVKTRAYSFFTRDKLFSVLFSCPAAEFFRVEQLFEWCVDSVSFSKPTKPVDSKKLGVTYTHPRTGVSIHVPLNWECVDTAAPSGVFTFLKASDHPIVPGKLGLRDLAQIHVMVEKYGAGVDLETVFEQSVKELMKEHDEMPDVQKKGPIEVDGMRGVEYVVSQELELEEGAGKDHLKYYNQCFVKGNLGFVLRYGAFEKMYKASFDEATSTFKSFHAEM
eukprot:TRINITY_DN82207_c0_g1_i1.p1 TRINITY_DN82207_c0_g1~~TRINITY_DN82207_c0_g1_i1.p1  ORF type:complete len:644 (+),score=206.56 TRINITY_DN82207_c0_g1_i1:140-2071(+)